MKTDERNPDDWFLLAKERLEIVASLKSRVLDIIRLTGRKPVNTEGVSDR